LKILLTGKNGQVGSALQRTLPEIGEVIALERAQLDLAKPESVVSAVRAAKADVIVNAAAYTAVDRAEGEENAAMAANRDGPASLAQEAARTGALLVHFSTDYVFDGYKPAPYVETDATHPLNAYGRSKLAGEQAIAGSGCRYLILRTSWVYSDSGKNFLLTMLRLGREKKELRVVDDQRGAPTSSYMLAAATPIAIRAVKRDPTLGGLYHMTAGGSTTWCGFARAILGAKRIPVSVAAIASADYATPARRPVNSILDNSRLNDAFGIRLPSWESGMQHVLSRLDG
jgi:dTDP-4-dehydrorhamnose reductase